jgi:hypothetical protein
MPRRSAWEPGNVFEVALPGGSFAYGIVIDFPLVAFFDFRFAECPPIADILSHPVAFRIWVMRSCLSRSGWPVIGFASVPDALSKPPDFYKFDRIARRFSLYRGHSEEPATREQCLGLELRATQFLCRESRCSEPFMSFLHSNESPNHALQRTAPCATAPAGAAALLGQVGPGAVLREAAADRQRSLHPRLLAVR